MRIKQLTHSSWNFKRDFLLKLVLFATIIVIFGHNESGYMPIMVISLAIVISLKGSPQILNFFKNYPVELKLINIWGLWVFFTGIFVSKNMIFFWDGFLSLLPLVLTINLVYLILLYDFRLIRYIIVAVFISGIIQLIGVQLGWQSSELVDRMERTGRQYGLTSNPNSFGLKMVYSSIALLTIVGIQKTRFNLKWICTIATLGFFLNGIFTSASRKSAIAFFMLIVGFLALKQLNRIKKVNIIKALIVIFIFGFIVNIFATYFIEGTALQERFVMGEERGGLQGDSRYDMYLYALNLFADNPFFGIGLNNYRAYFYTGQYSHSDYAESLSSTGLFGFIIYQLFYIIPLIKGYKLSKLISKKEIRFYLLFGLLIIVTIKLIGTGIILYQSPSVMIIMTCIIAYFQKVKKESKLINSH